MLTVRRMLLRDLLASVGAGTLLLVGLGWIGFRRALDDQARPQAELSLHLAEGAVRGRLQEVERMDAALAEHWRAGDLDPGDPDRVDRLLLPLLRHQRPVTSVNLCRPDGTSVLLLQQDGAWSTRALRVVGGRKMVAWTRRDASGRVVSRSPWAPTDYDPRERPWYKLAAASPTPVWTGAYAFYTTRDPGITHVIAVRDAGGQVQGVLGLDFLLDDLTGDLRGARPTPHAQAALVDESGRVVALPEEPGLDTRAARRDRFLAPLDGGRFPVLARALRIEGEAARFRAEGGEFLALRRPLEGVEGLRWSLVMALPDEDLLGRSRERAALLLALAAAGLALLAWRAWVLARRVSDPLDRLSEAAGALGRGEPPRPVESPLAEVGHLSAALALADRALREREGLEAQLRHSQRLETVGTLAGGLAHDVNNQLAIIQAQLDLLELSLPQAGPRDPLARARQAVAHCAELTRALLAFSRPGGAGPAPAEPVQVNPLVLELSVLLERVLGGRVEVKLDLAPDLPPLQGDRVQLEQVLLNLAVNARDAMPEGGLLSLRTHLERGTGRVLLEVEDTGAGMAPEVRSRIFEPFFTTKGVGEGTGLGLSMVLSTVQAHGGTVAVRSEPGRGSRFTLAFPAGPGLRPPAPAPAPEAPADRGLEGLRVLLVDDEAPLRELLGQVLGRLGAQVRAAGDGEAAWELLMEDPAAVDLVVSDQRMPRCTGLQLLQRMRARGLRTPLILASGFGLDEARDEARRDPGLRLLAKPFQAEALIALVRELTG